MLPSLVKLHDVAAQARLLGRRLLDLGRRLAPGRRGGGVVHVGRDLGVDGRGHVLDRHEDVQFQVGRLGLLLGRLGVVTEPVVVLVGGAQLRQRVGADVVVGHDQAVGRHERARAAVVESDGRGPQVVRPTGRGREPVARLERFQWKVVEDPHPLVAARHVG